MVSEGWENTKGAGESGLLGSRAGPVWTDPRQENTAESLEEDKRTQFPHPVVSCSGGGGEGTYMQGPWVLLGSQEGRILCQGKGLRGRGGCYSDGGP